MPCMMRYGFHDPRDDPITMDCFWVAHRCLLLKALLVLQKLLRREHLHVHATAKLKLHTSASAYVASNSTGRRPRRNGSVGAPLLGVGAGRQHTVQKRHSKGRFAA
eukprot:76313-Chlamydomonas_euryale.AAC.1